MNETIIELLFERTKLFFIITEINECDKRKNERSFNLTYE